MATNGRRKGGQGERECRDKLRELFPHLAEDIRRGQQYCGLGEADDVVGLPGIHIECKRVEKLNLEAAIDQALTDATPDEVPVVLHRKNHRRWLLTVNLDDIHMLYQRLHAIYTAGRTDPNL